MIILAGADIVLPDGVVPGGSLVLDEGRIAAIEHKVIDHAAGATRLDVHGCLVVPGFIDVHVHGVEGHDVLDGAGAVREVATRLPRYGVTSFCPTSIACRPGVLEVFLKAIDESRGVAMSGAARVLPAHLESNFINPDYAGAQPVECLRRPRVNTDEHAATAGEFGARDILQTLSTFRTAVGIVTLAPELEGGLELVEQLTRAGHIVSIGHTGATYEQARASFEAGVRHATHLFNRMTALSHRAPGAAGAILQSEAVVAELICDGHHVHPALIEVAVRAKGTHGVMAITDGTAGAGLPVGSRTFLGGRPIVVTARTAELEDGTLAGSVLTMDGAFRTLVQRGGMTVVQAAALCATTPARHLGLRGVGRLEPGGVADLAVLDGDLHVRHTFLNGVLWRNPAREDHV